MPIVPVLILAAFLFSMGIYGLLARRNAVMVLLDSMALGQIFSIFIITVAAAEVGIGLAIVLMIFRNSHSANLDDFATMKG